MGSWITYVQCVSPTHSPNWLSSKEACISYYIIALCTQYMHLLRTYKVLIFNKMLISIPGMKRFRKVPVSGSCVGYFKLRMTVEQLLESVCNCKACWNLLCRQILPKNVNGVVAQSFPFHISWSQTENKNVAQKKIKDLVHLLYNCAQYGIITEPYSFDNMGWVISESVGRSWIGSCRGLQQLQLPYRFSTQVGQFSSLKLSLSHRWRTFLYIWIDFYWQKNLGQCD